MKPPVVVAIDGPSGVGKSTIARGLARRLEVPYLDTGAMYRCVGWFALQAGFEPTAATDQAVLDLLAGLKLEVLPELPAGSRILVDGRHIDDQLRTPEVSRMTSVMATRSPVRRRMVLLQREFARLHGGVLEGRDIATVVAPGTPFKFFLDARPEIRARRRWRELAELGHPASFEKVLADQEERDRRDSERPEAPLRLDPSHTLVDTSDAAPEEVVATLLAAIRGAGAENRA